MKQVVMNATKPRDMTMYMRAGPRESVYYHPDEVRAAIVSCGVRIAVERLQEQILRKSLFALFPVHA